MPSSPTNGHLNGAQPEGTDRPSPYRRRLVDPERVADRYERKGGTAPRDQVLRRAEYLATRSPAREAQRWADFTEAPIAPPVWAPSSAAGTRRPVPMRGPNGAHHVRLLGLRADEPRRVDRVLSRALLAEGAGRSYCSVATQPPGERPYFPLYESGFSAADVDAYWSPSGPHNFALDIPDGAGNCTFCFMKGTKQLAELGRTSDDRRVAGTPSDINWWADFEHRHARTEAKRNGSGLSRFGFFGVNATTFQALADGEAPPADRYATGTPACDCTD